MNIRKIAATLVAVGLTLGLFGAGIGAQFTDSAVTTTSISVGTFAITVDGPGGVVTDNGKTVTFTCPAILSSATGQCTHDFTINNVGSIPAAIAITITATNNGVDGLPAGWSAINAGAVGPIAGGATATFTGGIAWPELFNADLSRVVTVTYHIAATA